MLKIRILIVLTHHSHHVLRVRLQRLALLVGVVVLVIGPLQADLGVPEHGVADVLVEAQVRQPALAGYAKIVNTIFPEHGLGVAGGLPQLLGGELVEGCLGLREARDRRLAGLGAEEVGIGAVPAGHRGVDGPGLGRQRHDMLAAALEAGLGISSTLRLGQTSECLASAHSVRRWPVRIISWK